MRLPVDKNVCCGCSACCACCRVQAIVMKPDSEGFLYPVIDQEKCVNCGLCNDVCPVANVSLRIAPVKTLAAKAKDDILRSASSSGGMFSLLASKVLFREGAVFGASFDTHDWHVYHRYVESNEELAELRGSKYVQSEIGQTFLSVAEMLELGREVMFTGTPCQIAGLKSFLDKRRVDRAKLLLVDVVCHAVPSPLVWKRYLEKRIVAGNRKRVVGKTGIARICFRNKTSGWKTYSMSLDFTDGSSYRSAYGADSFMKGFLSELYNRPSCCNCNFRKFKSGSDITIADYWGVGSKFVDMDDDKGTSLLFLNTDKGASLWREIEDETEYCESDITHACKYNSAIIKSKSPHSKRSFFFSRINKDDFDCLVNRCLRLPLKHRVRMILSRIIKRKWLRFKK